MNETLLANPRARGLLLALFVVVASAAAGWGIYTRTGKVLGILALLTVGVFLRQATFPNGFAVLVLCAMLSLVQPTLIKEEFEVDKWIALFGMAAISLAVIAFRIHDPPWPGVAHVLVAGLVGIAAFSTFWSLDPPVSFAKAGAFGLGCVVVFGGVWSWATTLERVRTLLDRLLDTFWFAFPLTGIFLLVPYGQTYLQGRFQGIYTNPNQIGFFGSVGLPLLLASSLTSPSKWRRRASAFVFACGVVTVILSGSRGGILGAGIGCVGYLLARFPRRTLAALGIIAVAIGFVRAYGVDFSAVGESVIVRSETIGNFADRSIWWEIGLLIAAEERWFGHGFGIGDSLFEHYLMDFHVDTYGPTIHNSYLDCYMTIGLVGIGCLIALQCWCGWLGLRTWWRDRNGEIGLIALALLASAVATSAHAFVETVLLLVGNPWTIPFYTMLILMVRMAKLEAERRHARAAVPAHVAPHPTALPA